MNFLDNLPTMDLDGIKPMFPAAPVADKDKPRQLNADRKMIRRADKAVMLDARRLANAIEHIGRLPAEAEAFHLITEKRYSMMHVIPAVLHLAAPATIRYLAVVTLSFSQPNMLDLLAMLDSGQIGSVDFAYSCYFKSNEKQNCQRLTDELTSRGQRVFSGLIHAKILAIELTDGRAYSVESSANLRSCASIEQITLTHDRALFDFHRQWISEIMETKK
jgi:hypothetical protein